MRPGSIFTQRTLRENLSSNERFGRYGAQLQAIRRIRSATQRPSDSAHLRKHGKTDEDELSHLFKPVLL